MSTPPTLDLPAIATKLTELDVLSSKLSKELTELHSAYSATVAENNAHLHRIAVLEGARTAAPTNEIKADLQHQLNILQGTAALPQSVLNIRTMFAAEKVWQAKYKELDGVRKEYSALKEQEKELKQAAWKQKAGKET
jgi:hypothetical protein